MGVTRVTTEDLHRVAGQLESGSVSIFEQLDALRGQIDGLVDASWEGAASQSFRELYEQWNSSGRQLSEALSGIGQMLGGTAEAYEVTEQDLAARFRQ